MQAIRFVHRRLSTCLTRAWPNSVDFTYHLHHKTCARPALIDSYLKFLFSWLLIQNQKLDSEDATVNAPPQSLRSAPCMSSTDRSFSSTDASSSSKTVPAGCFTSALLRKRCAPPFDYVENAALDRSSWGQENSDVSSPGRTHQDAEVLRSYEDYLQRFRLFSHEAQALSREEQHSRLNENSGGNMRDPSSSSPHYPAVEVQMDSPVSRYFLGSSFEKTSEAAEGLYENWAQATLTDLQILPDTYLITAISGGINWRQVYRAGPEGETRLPLALQARRPCSLAIDSGLPSPGIW